jgi:type I restriction enzyme M protein
MVIDEGVLFRTNEDAFVETQRKLTVDLWCVLSLPAGVFSTLALLALVSRYLPSRA